MTGPVGILMAWVACYNDQKKCKKIQIRKEYATSGIAERDKGDNVSQQHSLKLFGQIKSNENYFWDKNSSQEQGQELHRNRPSLNEKNVFMGVDDKLSFKITEFRRSTKRPNYNIMMNNQTIQFLPNKIVWKMRRWLPTARLHGPALPLYKIFVVLLEHNLKLY